MRAISSNRFLRPECCSSVGLVANGVGEIHGLLVDDQLFEVEGHGYIRGKRVERGEETSGRETAYCSA
jgi:hypothetical protein